MFGYKEAHKEWLKDSDDNLFLHLEKTCSVTGRLYEIDVPYEKVMAYQNGQLLQNALTGFNAEQREFFKTGLTPDEWNEYLGVEDEDSE